MQLLLHNSAGLKMIPFITTFIIIVVVVVAVIIMIGSGQWQVCGAAKRKQME